MWIKSNFCVFHVCVSSLGVGVLERIVNLIFFFWSDFELQKSLQKIVFIKNSLYLPYLCKSFKFQFVTFIELSMDWLFVDERLFFGILLFFFVRYFNYLKDLYFYILFCFWNEIGFSLMFLNLTIVDLSMNEWFYLRTVRAIAKARKIVQISICVFDLQRYILRKIFQKSKWHILLKRMFVIHFQVFRYTYGGVS